ncbi:hypothetical protein Tco_1131974 [Tanacetum coccineum]|uniref:Uncharacterized protein n=1 Tax=Tanacetum coccineum TaxID=301880 RepID=A0ABQ5JAN8_9ASTR
MEVWGNGGCLLVLVRFVGCVVGDDLCCVLTVCGLCGVVVRFFVSEGRGVLCRGYGWWWVGLLSVVIFCVVCGCGCALGVGVVGLWSGFSVRRRGGWLWVNGVEGGVCVGCVCLLGGARLVVSGGVSGGDDVVVCGFIRVLCGMVNLWECEGVDGWGGGVESRRWAVVHSVLLAVGELICWNVMVWGLMSECRGKACCCWVVVVCGGGCWVGLGMGSGGGLGGFGGDFSGWGAEGCGSVGVVVGCLVGGWVVSWGVDGLWFCGLVMCDCCGWGVDVCAGSSRDGWCVVWWVVAVGGFGAGGGVGYVGLCWLCCMRGRCAGGWRERGCGVGVGGMGRVVPCLWVGR